MTPEFNVPSVNNDRKTRINCRPEQDSNRKLPVRAALDAPRNRENEHQNKY
jgi:hypothetical protein